MQETISDQIIQAFLSGRRNMQLEQLANTAPFLLETLRMAKQHIEIITEWAPYANASDANIKLIDYALNEAEEKQGAS